MPDCPPAPPARPRRAMPLADLRDGPLALALRAVLVMGATAAALAALGLLHP